MNRDFWSRLPHHDAGVTRYRRIGDRILATGVSVVVAWAVWVAVKMIWGMR